jgi:peptidase M23-like protein/fibronectin type III domain protein
MAVKPWIHKKRFRLIALFITLIAALAVSNSAEAIEAYVGVKLPYMAGEARVVVRSTGHGPGRHAVDFGMYYEDVLAMHSGTIYAVVPNTPNNGNYIVLDHGDNYCSLYLHLDKFYVKSGQSIQQGERIALSGNTGKSSGPHLHAAVFRKAGGVCAGSIYSEVPMFFDERPQRELEAGDWVVSQNGRPIAPYYPSLDNITDHSILVRWNDYSNNEDGFKIERRIGKGAWSEIASIGGNSIKYDAAGLSVTTPYCFRIRAYNKAGYSPYSNIVCATTKPSNPNQQSITRPQTDADVTTELSPDAGDPPSTDHGVRLLYSAVLRLRIWFESMNLFDLQPDDDHE